jgi:hypothetical protein
MPEGISQPSSNVKNDSRLARRAEMSDALRLVQAIVADDLEAVNALIDAGVDVNASEEPHWPRLIAAGADVERDVGEGWTLLAHAIDVESDVASQAGRLQDSVSTELVELLLAAGAEPSERAFKLMGTNGNHKALALLRLARRT